MHWEWWTLDWKSSILHSNWWNLHVKWCILEGRHTELALPPSGSKIMNFVSTRIFVLKTRIFALKMMNFADRWLRRESYGSRVRDVSKMTNFILKMMNVVFKNDAVCIEMRVFSIFLLTTSRFSIHRRCQLYSRWPSFSMQNQSFSMQ